MSKGEAVSQGTKRKLQHTALIIGSVILMTSTSLMAVQVAAGLFIVSGVLGLVND